jgi:hypothetical protein
MSAADQKKVLFFHSRKASTKEPDGTNTWTGSAQMRYNYTFLVLVMSVISYGCKSRTYSSQKLIGGKLAKSGQFPASVNLTQGPTASFCTGSFVSKIHLLTAAHCVVAGYDGPGGSFDLLLKGGLSDRVLYYAYGPEREKKFTGNIKNFYIPEGLKAQLKTSKGWGENSNSSSPIEMEDVAIIELESPISSDITLAKLSERIVETGMNFIFGGYGCQSYPAIPAKEGLPTSTKVQLKYTKGKTSKVTTISGFGAKYTGAASQSMCPGDSGGPVYFDNDPGNPNAGSTEVIGVNSFVSLRFAKRTEGNFTLVTTTSKFGKWVQKVLRGSVEPFKEN